MATKKKEKQDWTANLSRMKQKKDWMAGLQSGSFGAMVREKRLQLKWNQMKLSEKSGVSQGWVSKIECGVLPSLEHGLMLMDVLDLNIRKVMNAVLKRK